MARCTSTCCEIFKRSRYYIMLSKLNNKEGLLDLQHVFRFSSHGIYLFTAKSPEMQRLIAEELCDFNIVVLDYSKLNEKYSFYKLEDLVYQNQDTKIFMIINLQNAIKDQYDILNFNLSRDMLFKLKKILVFGMTEFLQEKLLLKALDLYSCFNLKVNFEDETPEKHSNYQFISVKDEFIDPGFIDDLLEDYKELLEETSESILSADIYEKMASLHGKKFEYGEALEYFFKALQIRSKIYGQEQPYIAIFYVDIGEVYRDIGDYDKALEYCFKALELREKVLGKENRDTADTYVRIGLVYNAKGEYDKALNFYFKALEIFKKVCHEEDQFIATTYNNIGMVYIFEKDYDKALEFYSNALEIYEKSLIDKEHISIAAMYSNIGIVYDCKEEYDKALEFYFKALNICEKVLRKIHPSTADIYYNLGIGYAGIGNYDKALEFYFKALEIREKAFGKEHPSTAVIYHSIGEIYHDKGEYEKAAEFNCRSLQIKEKLKGATALL